MSLDVGQQLGSYEITGLLGKGGMGEVYRARDIRLKRQVAIKVLPDEFSRDTDRVARFQREAVLLASLNHPHIAAIYHVALVGDLRFLVLELVEGETLAARIARGPLRLDEALGLAKKIVEALEAAHEQGIVHRDLKPANIKIAPNDVVKVLDFGLAKSIAGDGSCADISELATLNANETSPATVVGTAAYMSPEQAQGRTVDKRTDIFAFGCVLYEMLTGKRAFEGENVPDILSRVLQRDPDWTFLPSGLPPRIRELLALCLEKDVKKRRQSAGDVRIDIEQALREPVATPVVSGRGSWLVRKGWLAGVIVLAAALAIPAGIHFRESPPAEMRLQIVTPPTLDPLHFALAPDGKHLVFVASASSNNVVQCLFLRTMEKTEAEPLAGTDGARLPFWSADSRSIGFFASGKLFRIDIAGGPPQELAAAVAPQGGAWGPDGTILFAPNTVSPLLKVPASGGKAVAVTKIDQPQQSGHRLPALLPDGRRFLFHVTGDSKVSGIYLGSFGEEAPKRLIAANSAASYLAPDLLIFVQQGALVARRFDADRGELTGDPVTIAAGVRDAQMGFSVSTNGVVAFRAGIAASARLAWFDRKGMVLGRGGDLNAPELSPDERYVAYDRTINGNRDVWIMDLLRDALTPFTRHPAVDGFPVWSPDGSRIAFHSQRKGTFDIWIKPVSGASSEELLLETPDNEWPLDWSRDGRFLLYRRSDSDYTSSDLWALPMTVKNPTPVVIANAPFEERMGEFSPDGHWIAYETEESGRPEIVLRAFPVAGGVVHVSTNGGTSPRWSADGKEIYFISPGGTMMTVPVATAGSTLIPGKPQSLFATNIFLQPFKFQYAVSRDGRFLLNNRYIEESANTPITLILNWKR